MQQRKVKREDIAKEFEAVLEEEENLLPPAIRRRLHDLNRTLEKTQTALEVRISLNHRTPCSIDKRLPPYLFHPWHPPFLCL